MQDDDYDNRITEARQFLKFCNDADSNNRAEALEDILFCSGDQWPVELQNSRSLESRPCLTINKLDAYCRQITNQQRQQRPRIKVHGMNNESDAKVAEILQGICRHIEVNSNADDAYDHAFDFAVRMGATVLEGAARESIARLWKRYGFQEKYRIVEVKL